MKKGLLIIALILAMVLSLILFSRNQAEVYYGEYININPLAGYPGICTYPPIDGQTFSNEPILTLGGILYVPARDDEPSQSDTIKEKESSPRVLVIAWGGLPSKVNHLQNTLQLGSLNIFPDIMPPLGIGPISYPAFPEDLEWLWPDFTAMPSSSPILLWTSDISFNPYRLDVYYTIPPYFP